MTISPAPPPGAIPPLDPTDTTRNGTGHPAKHAAHRQPYKPAPPLRPTPQDRVDISRVLKELHALDPKSADAPYSPSPAGGRGSG